MAQIILGSDTNPGGRKYNEDRTGTDAFVTKSGLNLAVAIVCDGVGGEERGERAAQLAIDAFLAFLHESDIPETPRLLHQAVKTANSAAFNEAQRLDAGERMACTLVVVVVENGTTAYIANVGDSRIYLCRNGQLQQLSRDHTFANVMVWMGKLSAEAAAANPDASKVMRVLGTRPDVQPDMGFYLTTTEYGEANKIGRNGLKLQTGDSIMVCSDGLVKNTATTGLPLVSNKEIAQILQADEGPKAARGIMSIALGRIPVGEQVDNITLALAQTEDPARAVNAGKIKQQQQQVQQRETTRKMGLIAGLVGVPLCLLLAAALAVIVGGYNIFKTSNEGTATQLAYVTEVAIAQTQTVAAYTATPTVPPPTATAVPTSAPTLAAGELAKIFKGDELLRTVIDDQKPVAAPPSQPWYVAVKHKQELTSTGDIHMEGGTQMQFIAVSDARFQINLLAPGADLFFQTGPYNNGAQIQIGGKSVQVTIKGCLAAYYPDDNNFAADCFQGVCGLSINFGTDYADIAEGQQLKLDLSQLSATRGDIPPEDRQKYFELLNLTSAGRDDMSRCNIPNITATQTAQAHLATALAFAAFATRSARATSTCVNFQQQFPGTPCP
jgi:PPM family protein phosphatase